MLGSGPQATSVLLHDGNEERDERGAEREGRKRHECSCQREPALALRHGAPRRFMLRGARRAGFRDLFDGPSRDAFPACERPIGFASRDTPLVATERSSDNTAVIPRSLRELTVSYARANLLTVETLDLGSGAPASAALALERGPQPGESPQRGEI